MADHVLTQLWSPAVFQSFIPVTFDHWDAVRSLRKQPLFLRVPFASGRLHILRFFRAHLPIPPRQRRKRAVPAFGARPGSAGWAHAAAGGAARRQHYKLPIDFLSTSRLRRSGRPGQTQRRRRPFFANRTGGGSAQQKALAVASPTGSGPTPRPERPEPRPVWPGPLRPASAPSGAHRRAHGPLGKLLPRVGRHGGWMQCRCRSRTAGV